LLAYETSRSYATTPSDPSASRLRTLQPGPNSIGLETSWSGGLGPWVFCAPSSTCDEVITTWTISRQVEEENWGIAPLSLFHQHHPQDTVLRAGSRGPTPHHLHNAPPHTTFYFETEKIGDYWTVQHFLTTGVTTFFFNRLFPLGVCHERVHALILVWGFGVTRGNDASERAASDSLFLTFFGLGLGDMLPMPLLFCTIY
jgi:hypothetical protein